MNGYYIASWYSNKLYNAHMDPNVIVTVNGTEYKAGDLFDTASSTYVEKRYQNYVAQAISDGNDGDTLGDIVTAIPLGLHGGPAVLHVLRLPFQA